MNLDSMIIEPASPSERKHSMADIHVLLVLHDQVPEREFANYRLLLTEEERAREACFRFENDRRRYRVTRALLRTVLSRYYPLPPAEWRFEPGPYGRPEIVHPKVCTGLSFNLSHSAKVIALAVSETRTVGIDVECLRGRDSCLDIAEHYFAPEEYSSLLRLPAEQRPSGFLEYWTLKESYIKARGMGLSLPLHQFAFDLSAPGTIRFTTHPELADAAARWQFWQYRLSADSVMAICAERRDTRAAVVKVRRVLPRMMEEDLLCEPLRVG